MEDLLQGMLAEELIWPRFAAVNIQPPPFSAPKWRCEGWTRLLMMLRCLQLITLGYAVWNHMMSGIGLCMLSGLYRHAESRVHVLSVVAWARSAWMHSNQEPLRCCGAPGSLLECLTGQNDCHVLCQKSYFYNSDCADGVGVFTNKHIIWTTINAVVILLVSASRWHRNQALCAHILVSLTWIVDWRRGTMQLCVLGVRGLGILSGACKGDTTLHYTCKWYGTFIYLLGLEFPDIHPIQTKRTCFLAGQGVLNRRHFYQIKYKDTSQKGRRNEEPACNSKKNQMKTKCSK